MKYAALYQPVQATEGTSILTSALPVFFLLDRTYGKHDQILKLSYIINVNQYNIQTL
jgi:hypothetical protein